MLLSLYVNYKNIYIMKLLLLTIVAIFMSVATFSQQNQNIKPKGELKVATTLKEKKATINANDKDAAFKQKKELYLKLSNKEYRKQNNIPESFPVYKDNGNLYKDTKQHDIKIKEWIKNNEEEYKKIKEIINF